MFLEFESLEPSPVDNTVIDEEKNVRFSKAPPEPSPSTDLPPISQLDTRQATKLTDDDVMMVTGEIPIIERRDRPSSGQRSRPSSGSIQGSRPGSTTKRRAPKSAAKKDMSMILTHLKKNTYDDTGKCIR